MMEKFLKKYYKQLHFNSMPSGVRAKFFDWVKNDTLTDDMRNWVRDYLEHDANGNLVKVDGKYVPKKLPEPDNDADLSEDDARELFIAFQSAFAGMAGDLDSFKDSDHQSRDFVNEYFGAGKLFHTSPATSNCVQGINKILTLLQQHPDLKEYIVKNTVKSDGKPVFESKRKLDELLGKCAPGSAQYNTNNSVQRKIQSIAKTLSDAVGWYSSIDQSSPEYQAIANIKTDLDNVKSEEAFAMDPRKIPTSALNNFRRIYAKTDQTGLLQTLYFNKTVRSRFAKYDNGTITGPIDKAEESVNWQDNSKENFVDEKISDVLTPFQQLQKWVSDTYDDTIKKYEELRGASIFRRKEAKDIFKAIDKNKIKPKDGLKAILDKKADIEKKLDNPVARQHFKWFTEVMETVSAKMPKAVEGAWKNATQMKAVINQIILKATDPKNDDPHAIEKAESAMEIMTAMKYGLLTSKVMDAINGTDFKIFSDKDLSWNKNNDAIQFVTKAFDQSIKAAFKGVGYTVTIIRNKIMMSGMRFKNKDNLNGPLAQRFKEEDTNKRQALLDKNAADQNTIAELQQEIDNLNRSTTQNITQRQANFQQILNRATAEKQANEADYNRYNAAQDIVNNNASAIGEFSDRQARRRDLKREIRDLKNQLAAPGLSMGDSMTISLQIADKQKQVDQLTQEMKSLVSGIKDYRQAKADVTNLKAAHDAYEKAVEAYDKTKERQDSIPLKTARLNEATQEIRELTDAINDRNRALADWPRNNINKVLHLEKYWNFLQGNAKTYGFRTSAAQKDFDTRNANDALLNNYMSQNSL